MNTYDFDIIAFLREIAESLKESGPVISVTEISTGVYQLFTNDTGTLEYNANRNIGIELGNFDTLNGKFLISAIDTDVSITINQIYTVDFGLTDIDTGLTPSAQNTTWTAIAPVFFHGEPDIVNQKTDNYPSDLNMYPCIIVDEPLTWNFTEQGERAGWIDTQNNVYIAFCDYIGYAENDIIQDDFRNNAIIAMTKLMLRFIEAIKKYTSEDNYIEVRGKINGKAEEFKNGAKWDFSPTGVYAVINFPLENVYNIC